MGLGSSQSFFSLEDKLTFGKHKGETIQFVIDEDPEYLGWVLENIEWFKLDEKAARFLENALSAEDDPWPDESFPFEDMDIPF